MGLIELDWDGIAARCKPENQIAFAVVQDLNNKSRVPGKDKFRRRTIGFLMARRSS